ncbi:hypothetical protein SAMN04487785_107180 [Dyella jiangningensis]|uniref:hypothetical protein n=1 Tax=Dyella sp. AtDHG13 TaxID=1938897 RepID=UPI0008810CFB|nr:hypothetical protein [Dyella sp. AtDHG13]PXV57365.1 hypothetical protein BDW41_107194 [Dyella sp. AtDHG13]SDK41839.1 hypothetical protein SAMN04487785_107180 [Dyella jiangningensis]
MKRLLPLLGLLALTACSGKPPAPESAPASASTARVATPWDDMKKDEQRAANVQKTVDEQAKKQQEQIDAAQQ